MVFERRTVNLKEKGYTKILNNYYVYLGRQCTLFQSTFYESGSWSSETIIYVHFVKFLNLQSSQSV